jgi:DNA mismatch repair protein MutS
MVLDPTAVATLELFESAQDRSLRGSLLATLDRTSTPMGARTLRQWLLRPLLDTGAIGRRQDAVAALVAEPQQRAAVRSRIHGIGDLERLSSRAALGVAHARDLTGLRASLGRLSALRESLGAPSASLLAEVGEEIAALPALHRMLVDALEDEPPLTLREGGLIRESWSADLGEIKRGAREARAWIAALEGRERERTGIPTLRVRFNRVFGYGIEITHAQAARAPAEYVRRQTLTGAERYVTPELKDYEAKVLGAEERRRRLEYELFDALRGQVAARAAELLSTARALATLDVVAALAEVAHARGHVRPVVENGSALEIVEGRHPVLEARSGLPVTPNDLALDDEARVVILTGPNMAGKSVYLRQTGHIVVLAQMGAFVPARSARLGLVDRVFTRVGAQDNLARGQSTFLVEMVETASILHNLAPRSLVLLDEVGRGTSTFDGLALAWAIARQLLERNKALTLFATHYFEMTRIALEYKEAANVHLDAIEHKDTIVFLHAVEEGPASQSYGLQVAQLAGVPKAVIQRARRILQQLEEASRAGGAQADLFARPPPEAEPTTDALRDALAQVNPDELSPREALELLYRLKKL